MELSTHSLRGVDTLLIRRRHHRPPPYDAFLDALTTGSSMVHTPG